MLLDHRALRGSVIRALCLAITSGGCAFLTASDAPSSAGCLESMECQGTPFRVPGVPALTKVAAGLWHTCGLADDGSAWCWGRGRVAAAVPGGLRFTSIGAGNYDSCALTGEGTAYCWSIDPCTSAGCSEAPLAVAADTFSTIVVGALHTCALKPSGAAHCWGFNRYGEVGSARYGLTEPIPVAVPGGLSFTEIDAGWLYTCALTLAGALYCWGDASTGQFGRADVGECTPGPLPIVGNACSAQPLASTTTIQLAGLSTGTLRACALSDQRRAICWGDNGQGQLGGGGFGIRYSPGQNTDSTWSLIEAGGPTTCGITVGGGTYCWGLNLAGLHGSGTMVEISTTPQRVAGGLTFSTLSAGGMHMCALTSAGDAYCWGDNSLLQLGGR